MFASCYSRIEKNSCAQMVVFDIIPTAVTVCQLYGIPVLSLSRLGRVGFTGSLVSGESDEKCRVQYFCLCAPSQHYNVSVVV